MSLHYCKGKGVGGGVILRVVENANGMTVTSILTKGCLFGNYFRELRAQKRGGTNATEIRQSYHTFSFKFLIISLNHLQNLPDIRRIYEVTPTGLIEIA